MKLSRNFPNLRFTAQTLRDAASLIDKMKSVKGPGRWGSLDVLIDGDTWTFNDVEDFFNTFPKATRASIYYESPLNATNWKIEMWYWLDPSGSSVSVHSQNQTEILSVMNVFSSTSAFRIREELLDVKVEEEKFKIFVGHGHSNAWKELKDHLKDKHDIDVFTFESGARAGHDIRNILEQMLGDSSMAFLVLTGEDETKVDRMRARQNVIHETGLFQGRLGFHRAIVLLEEGVEEFSNLAGIQRISFSKGNIKETFGDVLATINREMHRK